MSTPGKTHCGKRTVFAVFILMAVVVTNGYSSELDRRAAKLLEGRTVQTDFGFAYYKDRSARSIAEEIAVNGYEGVYYFVTSDKTVRKDVISELHTRDIPVALMVIASGAYFPVSERPQGWEDWRMEFTNDVMDHYQFMSFVHKDYACWMKHRVVNLINDYGFDGFTFAEAMYPIANGLERENVLYGDISPAFQQKFMQASGHTVFPEFVDTAAPNYYKKIPDVYHDLVEFRVQTVNDFYDEVINGQGGVREKCPGVFVATWTLGINLPDGVEKLRQWEGNDIPSMIRQVRPDMHFIQTHAPDWVNPALKPDYVLSYKPFFDAVKQTDPDMAIGFQGDFVSHLNIRRSPQWQRRWYEACQQMPIDSTTYYVFGLRWIVYHEPPELANVRRVDSNVLELCFDQRLAKACEPLVTGTEMISTGNGQHFRVISAKVDGNLLEITLNRDLPDTREVIVKLDGIKDDPDYRFVRTGDWQPMPKGEQNVIAPGTSRTMPLSR